MQISRRGILAGASLATLSGLAFGPTAEAAPSDFHPHPGMPVRPIPHAPQVDPRALATNHRYWHNVSRSFWRTSQPTNLENGYWGIMPDVVHDAWERATGRVNFHNSTYLRTTFWADAQAARQAIADVAGCSVDEVCITRGATEALQKLIAGYNRIGPGDEALYVDLDYDSMIYVMEWLKDRRGCDVVRGVMPEPATRQAVLDYYEKFLDDHPRARLLLLTHLSHRTGLVVPVAEITEMAEARGVDVVVDVAHSWGQIDFNVTDLKAPFVGFNLHKWTGNPLGTGWMYIRKDRLADIDRDYGDGDWPATDIRSRLHTGSVNFASILTIPKAMEFHTALGAANKQARLQYLRNRWVEQVADVPRLTIMTPDDPRMYGALTSFRVEGRTTKADTVAMTRWLAEEKGVFTVRRGGVTRGEVIRVTPAIYTSPQDCDKLADALKELVRVF